MAGNRAVAPCDDSNKVPGRGPQAGNLIDALAKRSATKSLGTGRDKAKAADLPLWLEETDPTSCPGVNDTSLTNAEAQHTPAAASGPSIGGKFTKTSVKGGGNMSAHTVVKTAVRPW